MSYGFKEHGSLLFWNPATGERLASVDDIRWPSRVSFNPAGTLIAIAGNPGLYLVDPSRKEIIRQVERAHENGAAEAMEFSPGGDLLATAGRDGMVKLWGLPDLNLVRSFSIGESVSGQPKDDVGTVIAGSVVFSHDGSRLAANNAEGNVFVWDVGAGKEVVHYSHYYGAKPNSLAFTSDDRWLVTTDYQGNGIRLLSPNSEKEGSSLFTTPSDAPIEALDVSRTDGSVAFAYRVFRPGQKAAAKFEIWTLQQR